MQSKYKIVASDLDGTLLNDNSQVSDENFKAIKRLNEMGIKFIPVTGRTLYEMPKSLLECEDIDYIIYSDGAVIHSKKTNKSIKSCIEKQRAKEIFDILNRYTTMIEVYCGGYPVTDKKNINKEAYNYYKIEEYYHPVMDLTRVGVKDFDSFLDTEREVEIFDVFFRNEDERQECWRILNRFDDITVTTSMINNLEIMKKGVDKGSAITSLCEALNVSPDEIIVTGDSKNDISMFKVIDTCLAVKNADEKLKQAASGIICSNNESNIDYILKNYIEV
ncbi:MAG: Cof-type HAD-IIB family hydrolase [Eubacterium sp.]